MFLSFFKTHCILIRYILICRQMLTNTNWLDCGKSELNLQEQEESVPVFGDFLRLPLMNFYFCFITFLTYC